MLYYEKLNWDSDKISNCIKKEKILVLATVSNTISLYLPEQNIFTISNDLFDDVIWCLKNSKTILISNIKSLNKTIPLFQFIKKWNLWKSLIDINGLYYSKYGKSLQHNILNNYNNDYNFYYNKVKSFKRTRFYDKNLVIPTPILYDLEYNKSICNWNIYKDCNNFLNTTEYTAYIFRSMIFNTLENNGIYFKNLDKLIHPIYKVDNSYTGRVSCSWNKINFMALDKKSELNEYITSRFGTEGQLYNFDYDSFHPRIIFNIINKPIPYNINGHEYLANKYFKNTKLSHNEIKSKIFKLLYSGKFYDNNNNNNNLNRILENISSKIDFLKTNLGRWIKDVEDRKKLNYFIQKYEVDLVTEVMLTIINKLLLTKKYKSKIILYQYDSLIFDIHNDEKDILVDKIKNIMENINNMQFKVKVKKGNSLKEIR